MSCHKTDFLIIEAECDKHNAEEFRKMNKKHFKLKRDFNFGKRCIKSYEDTTRRLLRK